MTILIHIANVVFLLSYLVKDILWLRMLTVIGGLVLLAYNLLLPTPIWAATAWNVLFFLINAYQIHVLFVERRPVRLAPDELRLHQLAFRSLTLREFAKLLAVGRWENVDDTARIVRQGEALDRLMVVASGRVRIEVDGRTIRELPAGCFVGEMSFLSGATPTADVVATEASRLFVLPKEALRTLLSASSDLRAAVQMVIGEDLVAKLRPA